MKLNILDKNMQQLKMNVLPYADNKQEVRSPNLPAN